MSPLDFTCPICWADLGVMCKWSPLPNMTPPEFHAERIEMAAAMNPDVQHDAPSKEAFDKAVDDSGIV